MRHVDEDTLTLLALGEQQPDPTDAQHLSSCEQCRTELASLTAVVTAGRSAGPLEQPPAHLWERIAAQIAAEDTTSAVRAPMSGRTDVAGPTDIAARPGAGPARSRAVTRPPGRRDRPRSVLSRAGWLAAGLAAGVAGTLVVTQLENTAPPPPTIASAELEPLPSWSETGAARVEEVGDRRLLHVEVTGDVTDGFREVWLLDEAAQQLVSLGLLVGTEGSFDLPADLDLEEFVLVDVSREPLDGDPAHSGDSIVRGRLTT